MLKRPELGVCQWFHYLDYECVERSVELLHELGVRHLRTGISWADYHRPCGAAWYDWQMRQLSGFEVLLSIWHTPPSISEGAACNSPPRRLADYADFVTEVHERYEGLFGALELWNEPNNLFKWNFRDFDPGWRKFGRMIALAAARARALGTTTVLGGIIPVDRAWLGVMERLGALDDVDVVAFHAFPEMWWADHHNWDWYRDWKGWADKAARIARFCSDGAPWVTETGLATWDPHLGDDAREHLQVRMLEKAAAAPVDRMYWYSLLDLDPSRPALDGFHVDENHYHMGLVTWAGRRKAAFHRLRELAAGAAQRVSAPPDAGATLAAAGTSLPAVAASPATKPERLLARNPDE